MGRVGVEGMCTCQISAVICRKGCYGDYVLRDGLDYKEIGISPLWVGWRGCAHVRYLQLFVGRDVRFYVLRDGLDYKACCFVPVVFGEDTPLLPGERAISFQQTGEFYLPWQQLDRVFQIQKTVS